MSQPFESCAWFGSLDLAYGDRDGLCFRTRLRGAVVFGYAMAMNSVARGLVCASGAPDTLCDWRTCMPVVGVCGRVVYGARPSVRRRRHAANPTGGARRARGYARRLGAALDGSCLRNGGRRRRPLPCPPARARVVFPGQPGRGQRLRPGAAQALSRQALGPVGARRASLFVLAQRSPVRRLLHWPRTASACPLRPGNPATR